MDWPPALHVWPKGLALDCPRDEPQNLGMVQGGDGDGVGEAKKLSEPLSERPGLGPGGAAWVTVTRRALHVCGSACGAPGRECHPPASPLGTALTAPRRAMPTLPSLFPLGLAPGEEGWSCSCHSWVPALPCSRERLGRLWSRCCQPGSAGAAEPATSPAPGCLKGSSVPAVAARAGGAGWRSKALPFSQAQAPASPRLGPSATAGAVKSGLPLARTPGPELWLCGRRSTDPGGVWPVHVAGLGLCWGPGERGTGVSAAVGSLLLVSPGGSPRVGQGGGRSWLLAGVHWSLELSHEVVG